MPSSSPNARTSSESVRKGYFPCVEVVIVARPLANPKFGIKPSVFRLELMNSLVVPLSIPIGIFHEIVAIGDQGASGPTSDLIPSVLWVCTDNCQAGRH